MTEHSQVRTAQPDDEAGVLELCRLLHEENGLFGLDEDRVRVVLQRAWNKDRVIVGVIGEIGAPVACVCLYVTECWYSGDPDIEELFNFVHPDHRASAHAHDLIEFAKRCSDTLAIPLTMGVISNLRTEAKLRFYRRQLGDPAGFFFVHNRDLTRPEPPTE